MTDKKSYNIGNQNAKKDDSKDARVFLRVTMEQKNRWVKQAQKDGKKLSEFIIDKMEG